MPSLGGQTHPRSPRVTLPCTQKLQGEETGQDVEEAAQEGDMVVGMTKVDKVVAMVIKAGKVVGMAVEVEVVGALVEAKVAAVHPSTALAITVASMATSSLTVVQRC